MAATADQDSSSSSSSPSLSSNSSLESYLPSDLDLDDFSADEQLIQKAVAFINHAKTKGDIPPPSVRSVATQFNVPRSTLGRRLNGVLPKAASNAAKAHFTNAETEVLIGLITVSAERGFPLSLTTLRDLADHLLLAKHKGVVDLTTAMTDGTLYDDPTIVEAALKVGKNWGKRWLKKHANRIKKYKARKLDAQRAKALNPENVAHWFSLVEAVYEREAEKPAEGEDGAKPEMDPGLIYGMDETCGWFDYNGESLVLGGVGKKNQYSARKQSRESATLIVSTCADGSVLEPFCIFSAKKVSAKWVASNPLNAG
jgi:hypothetical protein